MVPGADATAPLREFDTKQHTTPPCTGVGRQTNGPSPPRCRGDGPFTETNDHLCAESGPPFGPGCSALPGRRAALSGAVQSEPNSFLYRADAFGFWPPFMMVEQTLPGAASWKYASYAITSAYFVNVSNIFWM